MADDEFLRRLAIGGAQRPDSFTGMQPEFRSALTRMFAEAPPEIAQSLRVKSGYRSPERQAQLWEQALKKYGSPEAARKWVAPPGRSNHNHGTASDIDFGNNPAATKWAHENASRYGLAFPLSNENWHVELASARGQKPGHAHDPVADVMAAAGNPVDRAPAQSPLAAMFGPTGEALPQQAAVPVGAADTFGQIAGLFAQQVAQKQKDRQAEQEAEQIRRTALFSPQALGQLYG